MKRFLLFILSLFAIQIISAQELTSNEKKQESNLPEILNNLDITKDPRLDNMLSWHIENNRIINKIEGFRVEIFFSSDLNAKVMALNKKEEFSTIYPNFNVHVKYISPNFRVRVGDFRTKNEALKLYREIRSTYPVAFIVADAIDFPSMKQVQYE
jgi:hypothetical protein